MQGNQIIPINGVIDTDSDIRLVKPGNLRSARNLRNGITDGASDGASENIKGFSKVVNPYLFSGTNIVIGSYEDIKGDSCIYCVYNSLGYNGIYRYFRHDPTSPNGRVEVVWQILYPWLYDSLNPNPLNFKEDYLITGMALVDDLFFWTDYNDRPRCINIKKANQTNKRRAFKLYLNPNNLEFSTDYRIEVFSFGNATPVATFNHTTSLPTLSERIAEIVFNSRVGGFTDTAIITGCSDHADILCVNTGKYYIRILEKKTTDIVYEELSKVIPDNFYPEIDLGLSLSGIDNYELFNCFYIDQARHMPQCEPVAQYQTDIDRQVNLVGGSVFYFRTRYIYDDNEMSEYGAISTISIPIGQCYLNTIQTQNNYIKVNFTDEILSNKSKVSLISNVELAMREHENGVWKVVKVLEPSEFVTVQEYDFYNDEIYSAIAQAKANNPFTSVPLLAKSLTMCDDRIFEGGIVEGYDKPCVTAKITTAYTPAPVQKTYTIKGIVLIRNLMAHPGETNYSACSRRQVILEYTNNGVRSFGGLFGQSSQAFMDSSIIKQTIPLAGFVFYLTGTDMRGVSKQYVSGAAVQNADGSYGAVSVSQRQDLLSDVIFNQSTNGANGLSVNPYGLGGNATDQHGADIGDTFLGVATQLFDHKAFSTFEIVGVPEGEYVIRIASHLTEAADLSDLSNVYQGTSTNVLRCGGADDFEVRVKVGDNEVSYQTPGNVYLQKDTGICYVGYTEIGDLAYNSILYPAGLDQTQALHGYIVDNDTGAATSFADLMADTHIDRAMVYFLLSGPSWNSIILDKPNYSCLSTVGAPMICDHNGYFFYATRYTPYPAFAFDHFRSGQYVGTILNAFDINNVAWTPAGGYDTVIAIRNGNANIKDFSRTHLTGSVILQGSLNAGVAGVNVVNTHGGYVSTDYTGDFSIVVYADTSLWLTSGQTRRIDVLIVSNSNTICKLSPASRTHLYDIIIESFIINNSAYDNTNPLYIDPTPFLFIELGEDISYSHFKRGWDGYFGIVYYDEADRCCAVVSGEELKVHILFYTELDENGNQVEKGYPVLTWEIYSPPPAWAVKYQWVRNKNLQLDRYLQFVANEVLYVSKNDIENITGVPIGNSDFLKINLGSIVFYTTTQHPESAISYTFQKGDRIRFIMDGSGNYFQSYKDFEVVSATPAYILIEKDFGFDVTGQDGLLFEIYTPRNKSEEIIFYEFGECYPIRTGVFNGIKRRYHVGQSQDQAFNGSMYDIDTLNTPASGVFKTGDVYYRFREMYINYDPPVPPITVIPPVTKVIRSIDDGSISDFFESFDQSVGRIRTNAIDIGRVYRPTAVRFSDIYIAGTKVNGLCSFGAVNVKQFSTDYGLIVKLILSKSLTLKAVFYNSFMVSMYINQGILREVSGSNIIAISDDVIPRTHNEQRTFGSQNPESIQLNDEDDLFGWDRSQGVVWRASGNGLVQISDYGRKKDFIKIGLQSRAANPIYSKVPSVYDHYHDELIESFRSLEPFPGLAPSAILMLPDWIAGPIGPPIWHIVMTIQPNNILIFDQIYIMPLVGAWPQNTNVLAAINAGTFMHGFSAVLNTDGTLTITAPNDSQTYGGAMVSISYSMNMSPPYTVSFQLSQGIPAVPAGTAPFIGDTMAFCKAKDGWCTDYDFLPEFYGRIRNELISFVNGELWLHGANPVYNSFYDTIYPSIAEPVVNNANPKIKDFRVHRIKSTGAQWETPELTIEPFDGAPNGMVTELTAAHYRLQEGDYWAKIKQDKNTPNMPSIDEAWVNGRDMRGEAMKIKMRCLSDQKTKLFETEIIYFYSEKS